MVIGLTGPTGSGKSTVANILIGQGFSLIDCDRVARQVVLPGSICLKQLTASFGKDILLEDGTLDRKKLASIAFPDPQKHQELNRIMFFWILKAIKQQIEQLKREGAHILMDAPTLFESGADSLCDRVLVVISSREKRLMRIMKRDKIDEKAATDRMNAQKQDIFYRTRADFIIENNRGEADLKREAHRFLLWLNGQENVPDQGSK